jgi:hypothetical protein
MVLATTSRQRNTKVEKIVTLPTNKQDQINGDVKNVRNCLQILRN